MPWFDWLLPQRRPHHLPDDLGAAEEQANLRRDVEQIQRLNEYLLNKAIAKGRLSPEQAAAIRASQVGETESSRMPTQKKKEDD